MHAPTIVSFVSLHSWERLRDNDSVQDFQGRLTWNGSALFFVSCSSGGFESSDFGMSRLEQCLRSVSENRRMPGRSEVQGILKTHRTDGRRVKMVLSLGLT